MAVGGPPPPAGAAASPGPFDVVLGHPDARLRPFVDRYVGYREWALRPSVRRQAAGAFVVLILGWGAPLDVVDPRCATRGAYRVDSFVAGTFDGYCTTRTVGVGLGVELLLAPLAARRILGVPLGELTNRAVAVEQLPGGWLARLRERVAETPDWPGRFRLLDAALAGRLAATAPVDPRLEWAWRRLSGAAAPAVGAPAGGPETGPAAAGDRETGPGPAPAGGREAGPPGGGTVGPAGGRRTTGPPDGAVVGPVGVGALADELGWSRRHLAATFRREVGLPPKVTARLLRFARAHAALTADRPPGTAAPAGAEVAARYGYSDQSHLIREFHEFAGVTPATLLRSHSSNPG
ncbi:hypothetical protein AWW66_25535 [Micromonospora rosaria]|uniref:HTH araC/xylS-type domain-containing protein n=1 Tax=Micromonospora rosaria TaxID=47874 RepID=A0A136PLB8_9ACTN|nr:hypothetical protein AWW66_25535 [Micromonospora rosaria]